MSSGVALAILASIVVVTFTVFAVIRMRRTFEEPKSQSGPQPAPPAPHALEVAPVEPKPPRQPRSPSSRLAARPDGKKKGPAYVAALEDEDDVPTTLYRKEDDPDVEALIAEFDSEAERKQR